MHHQGRHARRAKRGRIVKPLGLRIKLRKQLLSPHKLIKQAPLRLQHVLKLLLLLLALLNRRARVALDTRELILKLGDQRRGIGDLRRPCRPPPPSPHA